MPIITFQPADAFDSITVPTDMYPAVMAKIDAKASTSGKGVNYWTTFRLTEGKFTGKEFTVMFGSSMNQDSILGGQQMLKHTHLLEIDAIINNGGAVKLFSEPKQIDTDTFLDKPIVLAIAAVPDENGKLMNVINSFLPAGAEKQQTPFG